MQSSVLEYLERTARAMPDKPAITGENGSVAFRELRANAKALACRLERSAAPSGRPVGVYLPKSADAVTAFMAALYAGGFYVPLDVKNPPARIAKILENLGPEVVITNEALRGDLVAAGLADSRIVCVEEARPEAGEALTGVSGEELGEESGQAPAQTLGEVGASPLNGRIDTDPVYVLYTSGSTGEPKGVVITHRGVIDYIDWAKECYAVGPDSMIGSQAPFHFDNSTLDIYLMLATGATLVLIPEDQFMFPAKLLETMVRKRIDTIFWVPSALVHVANLRMLEKSSLPPLRNILFAGEVMPVKHLNYWRRHFPEALFSNLYGPTEITVDCTFYIVDREFSEDESLPIGRACANATVFILKEGREITEPGEIGELVVSGSGLAVGYWNNPEATAAAFTKNPLDPDGGERVYRTGDLVQLNDRGEILFVGRKDSQIKHMGYRIELGEIENAALGLPGIDNACVLYDSDEQLIALFYEATGEIPAARMIRGLQGILPKYSIPRKFFFLDKLPINSNGKIDRLVLRQEYLGPPQKVGR